MKPITSWERVYFAAVGLLALSVGVCGFFFPSRAAKVLPFPVPPLHARFLGAMYLSGLTFMVGAALSRSWAEVRIVPPMTAIWTGGLLLVSLLHLDAFDLGELPDQVWFAAYVVYPLIALWLTWQHRADAHERVAGPDLPAGARTYLLVQGILATSLGLLLLVAPAWMAGGWPWAITPLLAQLYSAPLLSYGVGCLLLSRQHTWPEVRVCSVAMLVFAALVLVGSFVHRDLFDAGQPADVAWFAGFVAATAGLACLGVGSIRASFGTASSVRGAAA